MSDSCDRLRERDLAAAFVALLKGDGETAVERANRWQEGWVARSISGLAYSFFLFEPIKAAECFGGLDAMRASALEQPLSVEFRFRSGLGAAFRREDATAVAHFRAAVELAPDNPYVLLGHAWTLMVGMGTKTPWWAFMRRRRRVRELLAALGGFFARCAGHPLASASRELFALQR